MEGANRSVTDCITAFIAEVDSFIKSGKQMKLLKEHIDNHVFNKFDPSPKANELGTDIELIDEDFFLLGCNTSLDRYDFENSPAVLAVLDEVDAIEILAIYRGIKVWQDGGIYIQSCLGKTND